MNQKARPIPESNEIDVQWGVPRNPAFPSDGAMSDWISGTLSYLALTGVELSVRLMSHDEIAGLNEQYRGKQGATNVLSFPGGGEDESGRTLLGDLALCVDVIREEAITQGKSLTSHTAHMLVHGTLHLAGYDHVNDDEAKEMEEIEVKIMADFGFGDPYEGELGV